MKCVELGSMPPLFVAGVFQAKLHPIFVFLETGVVEMNYMALGSKSPLFVAGVFQAKRHPISVFLGTEVVEMNYMALDSTPPLVVKKCLGVQPCNAHTHDLEIVAAASCCKALDSAGHLVVLQADLAIL